MNLLEGVGAWEYTTGQGFEEKGFQSAK